MKIDLRVYVLTVLLGIPGTVSAQTVLTNVTYICGGEHIYIDYCDKSEADTARCAIAHPEKLYNGGLTFTYDTKGNVRKLLSTCVQPTAEEIAREAAFVFAAWSNLRANMVLVGHHTTRLRRVTSRTSSMILFIGAELP
jgi:hypothetical protein